jgi:hypothetical protein
MAKLTKPSKKKPTAQKRVSKKVLSERAKKGWETRRKNVRKAAKAAAKASKKVVAKKPAPKPAKKFVAKPAVAKKLSRSEAAKKGWEKRRAEAAQQEAIRLKRSEAAKAAWEERKRIDTRVKRFELSTREDLRPVLPKVFKEKKDEAQESGKQEKKLKIRGKMALISVYGAKKIVEYLVDVGILDKPIKMTKKEALKLAKKHITNEVSYEVDAATKAVTDGMEIVERMYNKRVYGSVIEALEQSNLTFHALVKQLGMEDTDRTKLMKEMDTMSSTPMFDSYMHQRAADYGMDVRALYSFFNGSPTADFIL